MTFSPSLTLQVYKIGSLTLQVYKTGMILEFVYEVFT